MKQEQARLPANHARCSANPKGDIAATDRTVAGPILKQVLRYRCATGTVALLRAVTLTHSARETHLFLQLVWPTLATEDGDVL